MKKKNLKNLKLNKKLISNIRGGEVFNNELTNAETCNPETDRTCYETACGFNCV